MRSTAVVSEKKLVSVIIPAYNEELVLDELFERLIPAVSAWNVDYEIVLVDDGSKDRTWDIIKSYNKKYPAVKGVRFARNFGHQPAVTAGLNYVTGDAVLVIDADLQDPPELLVQFIQEWQNGADVVYAVRKKRKESLLLRTAYSLFYRMLQKLSSINIPLDSGDFCLMDRKVVDTINALPEKRRFVRGLRAWAGFKQVKLEYDRPARAAGETKYSLKKLIELALNGLLSFSSLPMRFASVLGLIIAGTSFIGFLFFLLYRIFDLKLLGYRITETAGTATVLLTVLFLGGIQLITIGIIGEYVGLIFEEVKARPTYVASETVGL